MGLGSFEEIRLARFLQNVNNAFMIVVGTVIFLLIALSIIMSRVFLKPIYDVLGAIEACEFRQGARASSGFECDGIGFAR